MSVLIKNGRIITAEEDYKSDIFVLENKIKMIGTDLNLTADTTINAEGKYIIPGGVDVHTHLDMPIGKIKSSDDFESGSIAAAFGGTTCIVDYATQERGAGTLQALEKWHKKAEGKAVIDYGFHMIITELSETYSDDLNNLIQEGVTSFKMFMAYPNALMVDDAVIFKTLKHCVNTGALLCIHAENGGVIDVMEKNAISEGHTTPIYHALTRPAITEGEAVGRSIAIAQMAGAPLYIVHLSTFDGLERITEAQNRGIPVYAETCPQYLFLSLEDMGKPGFEDAKLIFTPPVREKWNQDKLWEGLKHNSIQVAATDHCPFRMKDQRILGINDFTKIPNGGAGIEHRLQLLFNGGVNEGRLSLNRWVEICSVNPAKMFGLYPQKGAIAPGSDADLVIWNPNAKYTISAETHHMKIDYSMYEGIQVTGNAETVISRGEIIIENNKFTGKTGRGKYIKRGLPEFI
jgi:dihydropyrimidinase